MYNESAKKATIKYIKEKCDRIHVIVPKGKKDEYKTHAAKKGKSLSRLMIDLVEEDLQRSK